MGEAFLRGAALALCVTFGAVTTALAQSNQGAPGAGTALEMRAVTVKDQHQLRGLFGDKWEPGEVKARAAATCAEAGMRLVYFKAEDPDAKGQRTFAAVCQ